MSGSSGGYMPEITSAANTDCSTLSFVTSLTSPLPIAMSTLASGDILDVELVSPSSLIVSDSNGIQVGSLITKYRDNIIECIRKGVDFQATVIKVIGGNCEVRVKSK